MDEVFDNFSTFVKIVLTTSTVAFFETVVLT